jgi:hypothetical protein
MHLPPVEDQTLEKTSVEKTRTQVPQQEALGLGDAAADSMEERYTMDR